MNTSIFIIQLLLILLFTSGGLFKLTLPYARFTKMPFQAWSNDFKPGHIRLIGLFEAAAAIGMLVPLVWHSLSILTPLVAVGMALVMAGAMSTHLRRAEYPNMVGNLLWLGLALLFAYSRLIEFL